MTAFLKKYDPKGKNSDDIIKDISEYYKKVEALITALDNVIK